MYTGARYPTASLDQNSGQILRARQLAVRDVDRDVGVVAEEPFVYSTGNRGPGYVMIKGLPGQPSAFKFLTRQLANKVLDEADFDFIEGNATGGMVPAWQLRNDVSFLVNAEIPYCYLRGSRKEGGHGELITGNWNNDFIKPGMKALVVEELVNFAGTTTNAATEFRSAGYPVTHAACILTYDHPASRALLAEHGMTLVSLLTLHQLLDAAEAANYVPKPLLDRYRDFIADPIGWQLSRGLVVPAKTAQKAIERGYAMRELSSEEAIVLGAPAGKLKENVIYWRKE